MEKIQFKDLPDMTTPLSSANLNQMQDNMENAIVPIKLVSISDAAPESANIGDMYYNTTDNKVYTATAENTWNSGETPRYDGFYINTNDNTLFYYNGSTLIGVGGSGSSATNDSLPIGMIMPSASQGSITDWLLCDGSAVSRTEYSELYNAIGTTYGSGDGSTTFNLPNISGKMIIGYDPDDDDFNEVGKTGGSKTHTQTVAELAEHKHAILYARSSDFGNNYARAIACNDTGYTTTEDTIDATGENQPMDIMNPYIVLNYYIKAHKTAPIYATVKNEKTTSDTDVYSCNYINNMQVSTITNDNGTAIKYADGTMICYGAITVTATSGSDYYQFCNRTSAITVTFPASFSSTNDLTITVTPQLFQVFSTTISSKTTSSFNFNAFYPSTVSFTTLPINYVAFGKWK